MSPPNLNPTFYDVVVGRNNSVVFIDGELPSGCSSYYTPECLTLCWQWGLSGEGMKIYERDLEEEERNSFLIPFFNLFT